MNGGATLPSAPPRHIVIVVEVHGATCQFQTTQFQLQKQQPAPTVAVLDFRGGKEKLPSRRASLWLDFWWIFPLLVVYPGEKKNKWSRKKILPKTDDFVKLGWIIAHFLCVCVVQSQWNRCFRWVERWPSKKKKSILFKKQGNLANLDDLR